MSNRVILVTGTPCVGKTEIARVLASKCHGVYVNLNEVAIRNHLFSGRDEERETMIVDENRMRRKIRRMVKNNQERDVIIDGHYAVDVVPKKSVSHVFVLRRDPVELRRFMVHRGLSGRKLRENLASEILDSCLIDALNVHPKRKVCEVDVTEKSVEEIVTIILSVLDGQEACNVGIVDWLGKLERNGLFEEFLQI